MNERYNIWICAEINFRKWPHNPRIYTVAASIIAFHIWNLSGFMQYADAVGQRISPWVFPHLFSPVMIVAFGCFTALLFCDAPFLDDHLPFVLIRSGRLSWIIGQMLYLAMASFVYTVFQLLVSVMLLLPEIVYTVDWGPFMTSLAVNPSVMYQTGIQSAIGISPAIIKQFTPVYAMLVSFAICWLVTMFSGMVIFSGNLILGKTSGLAVLGWFIFFSYFALYLGRLTLAPWLFYLSPLNWSSLDFIDWSGQHRSVLPSPQYAVVTLLSAIMLMAFISVRWFCKKDVDFPYGGQ